MYKALLIIMFVPYLTAHVIELRDFQDDDEVVVTEKEKTGALQIRCTRRFSPGVCMEEVKPVWTYNFHLQNCTERLGCRQKAVTNRFISYRRCMISCQSLIHIYNHILSQSELNDRQWSPQRASFLRRNEDPGIPPEDQTSEDDSYEAPTMDPYDPYVEILPGKEDPEEIALAEILPLDLDRRPPDFAHFDPVHRPRLF